MYSRLVYLNHSFRQRKIHVLEMQVWPVLQQQFSLKTCYSNNQCQSSFVRMDNIFSAVVDILTLQRRQNATTWLLQTFYRIAQQRHHPARRKIALCLTACVSIFCSTCVYCELDISQISEIMRIVVRMISSMSLQVQLLFNTAKTSPNY